MRCAHALVPKFIPVYSDASMGGDIVTVEVGGVSGGVESPVMKEKGERGNTAH